MRHATPVAVAPVFALATLTALATFALPAVAVAFPAYLQNFVDHYDSNGIEVGPLVDQENCGTCHVRASGGGTRNAYGKDFDSIVLGEGKGFPGVEFLDSDADGFLNLEEIYALTSPGKGDSKPTGRVELTLSGSTLSVKPSEPCGTVELVAFGYTFGGESTFLLKSDSGTGTAEVTGNAGAILARCAKEGLAGSYRK